MNDRPKSPVQTPQEWLRHAEENLGVAEREMRYDTPVYRTVCFLCQSAAEKFLKAYLIAHGWTLKKTHDVVELLELCSDYDDDFQGLLTDGSLLNEYMVEGRYPGDLAFEAIGHEDAVEALDSVRRIRTVIVGQLAGESDETNLAPGI